MNTLSSIEGLSRSNSDYNFDLSISIPLFHKPFDLVIHTAGKSHSIPRSKVENQLFYDTNVLGTYNLLEGFSKSSIPQKFVYISSVSVYGLLEGSNINENTPLLATDPYGQSKIEAEFLITEWCKNNNVICTILRLPLIVGVNPPGNLGSMIKGIKKGYYFNIAGGHANKSMVLASDIAKFIIKASEIGGIYNLTDGCHPDFSEFSRHIATQLGKSSVPNIPKFITFILAKLGDLIGHKFPFNSYKFSKIVSTLTFDDSKARAAFGWNPTPVVEGFKIDANV